MTKRTKKHAEVYPVVGAFADRKAMKAHMKPLTDEQVQEWASIEGVVTKDYGSAPINRMRTIMGITELHFPSEPKAAKKESPYKAYTLEQLVGMAVEHDVPVEVTDDARILRMRTIMALRAAGKLG